MSERERQLTTILAAIAAAIGVEDVLRHDTRLYEDVSSEPINLQVILNRLEARFSINFSLQEVACLHGNNGLTVGDLMAAVDTAIEHSDVEPEQVLA